MTEDAINFYLIFITAVILTCVWLSFHYFFLFVCAVHFFLSAAPLGVQDWNS